MAIRLKQSTASQEIPLGYFVDSTDGNTEETGLTIANTDIKIWKNGATTLANKNSGGATHISNGIYYAVLDATDTNTLGPLVVFVHVSGALAVRVECEVLAANIYDSLVGGGDVLDVSVTQWLGTAVATPATAGRPSVDVVSIGNTTQTARDIGASVLLSSGTGTGQVSLTSGVVSANAVQLSGDSTAADNAEAFFDGTGYAGTNNVIPTVTNVTNLHASAATAAELAKVPKSDGTATWNATALASINAEADTALADYDGPTNAEMEARTIVAANYATAAALATVDGIVDDLKSGIIYGAAATGTLSTTQATTNLTGYADDQLIGRHITVLSGAAEGEQSEISDYANTGGLLTFVAMTVAMANGDTFKIT